MTNIIYIFNFIINTFSVIMNKICIFENDKEFKMGNLTDARGCACPTPVIIAKKLADQGMEEFSIQVDNQTAVENLKRFSSNAGFQIQVKEIGSDFEVEFVQLKDSSIAQSPLPINLEMPGNNKAWAIFIGKEEIGEGSSDLGKTLLKMFLYTLTEAEDVPDYIFLMNSGVKIAVDNEQNAEQLKILCSKGSKVLVCGACLNFFEVIDMLQVGEVSNMYEIVSAMKAVDKMIMLT